MTDEEIRQLKLRVRVAEDAARLIDVMVAEILERTDLTPGVRNVLSMFQNMRKRTGEIVPRTPI